MLGLGSGSRVKVGRLGLGLVTGMCASRLVPVL